jgi:hypothetical protein
MMAKVARFTPSARTGAVRTGERAGPGRRSAASPMAGGPR